jgi:tRNA dimethylallyltransferase
MTGKTLEIARAMADTRPIAIALMGPTASGKSALALEWAQRLGGEIVSVDSALVYRGLDIGAAKPTAGERACIAHHLLDLRDPWQPYSAAEFAHDARVAIDGIVARGRLPILAGGTGLYFRALLHGLAAMPASDSALRARIAREAETRGWAALHAELATIDPPAAARIHATDAQRIQRALEVHRLSGRAISDWQRDAAGTRLPLRVLPLVLAPRERATLHARIERRFDAMLAQGFLDEVRALRALPQLQSHPAPLQLPALRAVGYRQAWEHLDGATGAGEFRDRAIFATRQLARRQLTWLRGEFGAQWFDPQAQRAELEQALAMFLGYRPAPP